MIIGRTLETTFPPKHAPGADEAPLLRVEGLSGNGFENISFTARKGEIVGVAGVAGNGQPALLRALAGREPATGSVNVAGRELSRRALLESAAYMPADRLTEGLMVDLNVRENTAMTALDRLTFGPVVSRRREVVAVERELSELAVKAPSLEAPVSSLSGGNQQKVVMARAMLSEPAILVADEPTQGVDVGARAEIYRILREVAARGVPVVVASSDTMELEGPVRPRDRDVPRPGGRDARGRRRDRGADRPRCDQRDQAQRGAGGADRRAACRGSRGSSKATTRRSSSSRW